MSDLSLIEIHPVSVGRDAVAQQQPDGRLVVAVRPHPDQSYANAVEKTREAIERAWNRPITAEAVRQLLRPHWPEGARATAVDELLRNPKAGGGGRIPDAPAPVSVRVPFRRRRVQVGALATAAALAVGGFVAGWAGADVQHHIIGTGTSTVPFRGQAFDAFAERGGHCTETGPSHGTCIDVDGDTLTGTSYARDGAYLYVFYYQDGPALRRVTFSVFADEKAAEVAAQTEAAASPGTTYMTGRIVITGSEQAKVERYSKVIADHFHKPVVTYENGPGRPTVVYEPPDSTGQ